MGFVPPGHTHDDVREILGYHRVVNLHDDGVIEPSADQGGFVQKRWE